MLTFLLALADERDREKVEEIYHKYHPEMYKIARHILSGRSNVHFEAEEAIQNAFIKIIEYFDAIRFEENEASLHSYFLTIAANEALTIMSRHKDSVSLDDLANELFSDDFVEKLCMRSDYEQVVQAIISLDDRYSIPLQLKYVQQMTPKDIACILNMRPQTVYTNLSRGTALLMKSLDKEVDQHD